MAFYDKFPYTNFQELNLDRIIREVLEVKQGLNFVIENASLKYADPIQWNITSQYQANTVVIDPATDIAYISTKPVPNNILITDTNYWTPIFDMSQLIDDLDDRVDTLENKMTAAETDIVDLQADVSDIYNQLDSAESGIYAKVILPVLTINEDPTGNCMIFKKDEHALIIDLGYYTNYPTIRDTMRNAGITTIDYLFITHYHGDHTATDPLNPTSVYDQLIADFDCSDLICYIPRLPSTSIIDVDWIVTALNSVFSCVTTDNNTSVTWNEINFTVKNASYTDFEYYNANTTDYNDFSNIIRAEYKGVSILNTADVGPLAQQRCYDLGYAEPADLVTIPHHGVNGSASPDFMNHLRPLYAYISNGSLGYNDLRDPNVYRAMHYGTVFDNRSNRDTPVTFGITESGLIALGTPLKISGYGDGVKNIIYVNPVINDSAVMDGTSLYPFKTLRMGINACYGLSRIELLDDYDETLVITNNNGYVEINGNNHNIASYITLLHANAYIHDGTVTTTIALSEGSNARLTNIQHGNSITVSESTLTAITCTVTEDVNAYVGNRSTIWIIEPNSLQNPNHRLIEATECIVNGHFALSTIGAHSVGVISNVRGYSNMGRLEEPSNILLSMWKDNPPVILYDTTEGKFAKIVNGTLKYISFDS